MIPLRDSIPSSRIPVVNYIIILINILVFFTEISLGERLLPFIRAYGFVPAKLHYAWADGNLAAGVLPMFSSMFLHGGWLHLIGNMWTLFIFGDNVEDTLGSGRYLVFYLAAGVTACLTQFVMGPTSRVPMVGASGAIAGVMGAYFFLFPGARVLTLIPMIFFIIIEVPAYVFLGFWFLIQFYSGTLAVLSTGGKVGGVAFWAHVGGFVAGVLLIYLFKPGWLRDTWRGRPKPA